METILPDQSLCLTVLKIANSVLFGRPQKVDSIKKAHNIPDNQNLRTYDKFLPLKSEKMVLRASAFSTVRFAMMSCEGL